MYTDIVIDLQAEAVTQEANAVQSGADPTEWNQSSNARFDLNCFDTNVHIQLCYGSILFLVKIFTFSLSLSLVIYDNMK